MTMVSRALELPPPYTRAAPAYSPATSSAASSLFSADSSDSNVYEYGSKNTALRFSQHRRAGVRLPSYGREAVVDGEIYLRSMNHVESVTVSLRGEVKTTIESSTRPNFTSKLTLLDQPHVIWSGSNQVDIPIPHTIPFSFLFPIKSKERDEALPPSFIGALAEGTIRVKYTIVAHVRRKGWRGNTTIETEVFYLPRPLQPMLSPGVVNLETLRTPVESPYDARVVELPVKQSIAGKQVISGVKVHFACPLAVYLSTDSSVPFSLSLSSPTSPLEHLMQLAPHISVRLVRTTTIIARGLSHSEEMTCAHGVLHPPERYDELADQSVLATGSLAITDTTWTSWGIEGAARISYALRVTLPTSFQPELAYFDHKIPIRGLSGSYGASTSPDFSLVPTPATLLKKAVGYMPMRV